MASYTVGQKTKAEKDKEERDAKRIKFLEMFGLGKTGEDVKDSTRRGTGEDGKDVSSLTIKKKKKAA